MYHRYGRHGPFAWLRWYKRRYRTALPAVIPTVAIVRVRVPINTERVLLIIMPDREGPEYPEDKQLSISIDHQAAFFPPTRNAVIDGEKGQIKASPLQRFAERRAVDDADTLKELVEDKHYILLDSKLHLRRIRAFAGQDIQNEFLRSDIASEYEDLLQEYVNAYRRKFAERTQSFADHITSVKDDKEQQLREQLLQDRTLVQTRSPGDWHARDLVVLRILQIYYKDRLEHVGINELLELHRFIDFYETFVLDFGARNEVTWPTPDSFRS